MNIREDLEITLQNYQILTSQNLIYTLNSNYVKSSHTSSDATSFVNSEDKNPLRRRSSNCRARQIEHQVEDK